MKKQKYLQIFGLLVLLSVIFLTGCGGGGGGGGSTTSTMTIKLPVYYEGLDQEGSFAIPEGKEVRFYIVSKPDIGEIFLDLWRFQHGIDDDIFLADYYFAGKTGSGEEFEFVIPSSLKGKGRCIYAVIFLEDEDGADRFDPEEKSVHEIFQAAAEGKILFGFSENPDTRLPKIHPLIHGATINDFIFIGKAEGEPSHTIIFSLPPTYQGSDNKTYTVPKGKEVKFYAAATPAGDGAVIADHVFTGITGDSIICEIPPHLLNQERYFYAVVNLEGDFDLREKDKDEMMQAVEAGEILFGQAMDPYDEGNMELYYLVHGTRVDNFKLFGKGEGEPVTTITFMMPTVYKDIWEEGKFHQIPSGKKVKFYVPYYSEDRDENDLFSFDHAFPETTTGPATFEFELPSDLVGEERELLAIVIMDGKFKPEGKKLGEINDAVLDGNILLGFSDDYYILEYGITIKMEFFGTK